MDKLLEARYQERKIFSRRGAVNSTSPFHTWKQVLILSIFFSMKLQKKKSQLCLYILIVITTLTFICILFTRWSAIATHLPGRTDNEIKNFWNTHLKKKLIQMGFDPMTHQPRTDLFSSLPHLLALANLRDLMVDHHPLDEQAIRLQAEAVQLAKLQYLQYLLQSASSITTNSYGQNDITDMEALNLLSSIPAFKENPVLNPSNVDNSSSFSPGNTTFQPLHHPSLLAHLSDPQVPFNFQTSLNSEMGQGCNFTMVSQGDNPHDDSSLVFPFPTPVVSTMTDDMSLSNPGDASSSTSSYGGASSFWPELFFEDPIMHEIS